MERPKNLRITQRTAIIVIILFHVVGLVGLLLPMSRPLFLQIVPWHLLLMLLVTILTHQHFDNRFIGFMALLFVAGVAVEWIGVHKHWLFGNYAYGKTLGVKIFDIPLTIGVNWFLLIYAAGITMQRSRLKSITARVITGALLLVLLDLLIEPVAIHFDYWHWAEGIIPFKNYYCWFLVSAAMLFVFEKFGFKKQGIAAPVLLATEFVFFGVLGIFGIFV
ncbi:carotenoid biosynthesis protein [Mucilaginibacter psychrotolerans]|uniref:Carotenoid biosynthesis protein n=1 Tax=Mucilaginibacter psychrotolerans TaxID=1524096 RepID=A0A4Y8SQS2_9SPHI|nr:carotenoid biosynthesis protein [Mucilaginibacter psychrotolerans]TFF40965.1 carotenoid biosynthesis protein [Mucilaginibacter psychrotolerans]